MDSRKATEFVKLVARLKTSEEFGDDMPEQDDWQECLCNLIASAREIEAATAARKVVGAEAKFQEDVRKAEAAIEVLGRQPYPELVEACSMEATRLRFAIADPVKLYAIYRRADKRTPHAYGMVAAA